jgi:hypothetical protein
VQLGANITVGSNLFVNVTNNASSAAILSFNSVLITAKGYLLFSTYGGINITNSTFITQNMTLIGVNIFINTINVTGNLTILRNYIISILDEQTVQFNVNIFVGNTLITDVIKANNQNSNNTALQFN